MSCEKNKKAESKDERKRKQNVTNLPERWMMDEGESMKGTNLSHTTFPLYKQHYFSTTKPSYLYPPDLKPPLSYSFISFISKNVIYYNIRESLGTGLSVKLKLISSIRCKTKINILQ